MQKNKWTMNRIKSRPEKGTPGGVSIAWSIQCITYEKETLVGGYTEEEENCLRRPDVCAGVAYASQNTKGNQAEPLELRLST